MPRSKHNGSADAQVGPATVSALPRNSARILEAASQLRAWPPGARCRKMLEEGRRNVSNGVERRRKRCQKMVKEGRREAST